MAFVITLYVREGIVMASDSRMTLSAIQKQDDTQTTRVAVMASDSHYKLFLAPNDIGIATYVAADAQGIPIADSVEAFIRMQLTRRPNMPAVDEVAALLLKHFQHSAPTAEASFHVAGYKTVGNQRVQQVWQVQLKTGELLLANEGFKQGATWGGEADILARLLRPVWIKDAAGAFQPLPYQAVPWQFMTLQDSIDFAVFAIRTTRDVMRFLPRAETVGGPIDVLVIKPDGAFWVQHKQLQAFDVP